MSATQLKSAQLWGFIPNFSGVTAATFPISAALIGAGSPDFSQSFLAYGFVPDQSKTINQISAFISAITGTLAATDLYCDIFTDTSPTGGTPSSSLVSSNSSGGSAPVAATWIRWSITPTAVTAGTQYWLMIRSANATPASNFPTFKYASLCPGMPFGTLAIGTAHYGANVLTSTNGGGSYTFAAACGSGWRVGYTDGTYDGFPVQNQIGSSGATQAIYGNGANQVGVKFIVPPWASMNLRGVATVITKNGSPAGGLLYNLWTGSSNTPTLLDSTYAIANSVLTLSTTRTWMPAYFPTTHVLAPGTVVRVTGADNDAADTLSNSFGVNQLTMDTDANSLLLLPNIESSWQGTVYNGTSFTDQGSTPIMVPFMIILDSTNSYTSSGGGGGLFLTGMGGGMNP